jgi:hypothetical protein
MNDKLVDFIQRLRSRLPFDDVFNPWRDVDQEHELSESGPRIRKEQLQHYLRSRLEQASLLLVGEALGYQGGHFTGIAMTSERILLGHQKERGILPHHVLPDLEPRRTSKPALKSKGFTEPTATIVWQKLLRLYDSPLHFVLWNAFAWHPFQAEEGLLSNRKPSKSELMYNTVILKGFLDLFPQADVVGVGNVASELLSSLDITFHQVRHPAQGGAKDFRQGIAIIYKQILSSKKTR